MCFHVCSLFFAEDLAPRMFQHIAKLASRVLLFAALVFRLPFLPFSSQVVGMDGEVLHFSTDKLSQESTGYELWTLGVEAERPFGSCTKPMGDFPFFHGSQPIG